MFKMVNFIKFMGINDIIFTYIEYGLVTVKDKVQPEIYLLKGVIKPS